MPSLNAVKIRRTVVAGRRPDNTHSAGEPYVNYADKQFGVMAIDQTPVDLLAVRFFSEEAIYAEGDIVVYQGEAWKAVASVAPGPFDDFFWTNLDGRVYTSDSLTPPENPQDGDMWWQQDTAISICGSTMAPAVRGRRWSPLELPDPKDQSDPKGWRVHKVT